MRKMLTGAALGRMRRIARALGIAVPAVFGTVIVLEGVAQLWVRQVARRGKLFRTDATLGWRPLPDLDLVRRNANGDDWRIVTDSFGWRHPVSKPSPAGRVIVLGDSYAFGEGVDVEDRFDQILARRHPETEFLNFGVMGFGTDQQLLALEEARPRAGDRVLLLTYENDIIDILRPRFAGRAKPYYTLRPDDLVLHLPRITWREELRDKSYLSAVAFARREREFGDYTREDWRRGLILYEAIVRRAADTLARRGVSLLVVHHGDSLLARALRIDDPYAFLNGVDGARGAALDSALTFCARQPVLLRDGHWSAAGHRCAAEHIDRLLSAAPFPH